MMTKLHKFIPPQNFDCERFIHEAEDSFSRGDMEGALTCYERAFSICQSDDPLILKISRAVVGIVNSDLVPKISYEEAEKMFPHQTFLKTGQTIEILHDLIEWKHRNKDLGLESCLQVVRWLNALGDIEGVNKVCEPFLRRRRDEKVYEFYMEKAIAYSQVGDFKHLKEVCRNLDSSTDPEIIKYTKLMRREVFLHECVRLVQS